MPPNMTKTKIHSFMRGSPSNEIELILLQIQLIYMPLFKMRLPERTILNLNEGCFGWNNLLLILRFVINRELWLNLIFLHFSAKSGILMQKSALLCGFVNCLEGSGSINQRIDYPETQM